VKPLRRTVLALLLLLGFRPAIPQQAAQATLSSQFSQPSLSYLLVDVHSGSILAERWPHSDEPIAIGSLIKPVTAMAWLETNRPFPVITCHGTPDACWRPHGHGHITLQSAITESCNAYFLQLGRGLSISEANHTLGRYHLPPVSPADKAQALAGLAANWKTSPHALAYAYIALEREAVSRHFAPLLEGMRQSASVGTARAISTALSATPVLAKTGTARCSHSPAATADGFTAAFFPAEDPRLFLLVRVHGVTGADSAAIAGRMLRALEVGEP
jgi:cell division protein FtsI/penicillin-binding protein 2